MSLANRPGIIFDICKKMSEETPVVVTPPTSTYKILDADLLKSTALFGVSAYFMLPYVNEFSNKILKTSYNGKVKTDKYILSYQLSRRDQKVINLLYSYMFSNSMLKTLKIDTYINSFTNENIKTFGNSFFNTLLGDITLDSSETVLNRVFDAIAISVLTTLSIAVTNKAKESDFYRNNGYYYTDGS